MLFPPLCSLEQQFSQHPCFKIRSLACACAVVLHAVLLRLTTTTLTQESTVQNDADTRVMKKLNAPRGKIILRISMEGIFEESAFVGKVIGSLLIQTKTCTTIIP
jgi:hypothetical protein